MSDYVVIQKREWISSKTDNLTVLSSNVIYNYPIFGHSLGFPSDPAKFWGKFEEAYKQHKLTHPDEHFAIVMFGPWQAIIPLCRVNLERAKTSTIYLGPEATEHIFKSPVNINRGQFYKFFLPWLKTGLLTSKGQKWKTRRRLLTPVKFLII